MVSTRPRAVLLLLLLLLVVCDGVYSARLLPWEEQGSGPTVTRRDSAAPPSPADIVEECYQFLESHVCQGSSWGMYYHFYRPSIAKYGPYQWLWDDSAHMIAWSHRNVTNSILSMRTMLQMQQPDGRVPEIIFWGGMSEKDKLLNELQYSNIKEADFTQMPLLPYALRAIWNVTQNSPQGLDLLREFVPKLVQYYQWWGRTRAVTPENGLVSIIHSWESGLDASPLYDKPYNVKDPKPTLLEMYPKFIELCIDYHLRYGWNQTEILQRSKAPFDLIDGYFIVQDVGVNAVYAAGWGILADLAALFDQQLSDMCRQQQEHFESKILEHCWDEDLQRFVSWFKDKEGKQAKIEVEAVQSLFPLLLQSLPKDKAESIVRSQVMNPNKFWLTYPIPSMSADGAEFQPVFSVDLMWRGPTWPILNWFVTEGLTRHGYWAEANQLLDRWVALYQKTGVYEQYNPQNGDPYGPEGLGMSTLIVDWLYRLGRL